MASLARVFIEAKLDTSGIVVDAQRAGEQGGRALADGVHKGADGRFRDNRGKFVSAVDAMASPAADTAGGRAGQKLADGMYRDAAGRLRNASGRFEKDLDAATGSASSNSGRKSGQRLAEGVNLGFGSILRNAAGFAVTLGGIGIVEAAAKLGISTAAGLEQAQVGFTTLIGSGEKAKAFLTDIKAFAARTPFELPGLIDSSRLLLGVGVAAKDVIPTLTAWGDAAGALGISNDRFNSAMLALSQSMGAGKINAQDMNQIINAGIPVWNLMAEATGKTVPELRKLSSEGKLLSADILPKLQAQMEKDYGGSMAKQSQTLAGVWSTLKDTVAIGLSNAIQPLVPLMETMIPRAATFATAAFAGIATAFSNFIAGLQGRGALDGFTGMVNTLGLGLRGLVVAFRDGDVTSTGFVGAMERIGATVRDVVDAVRDIVGWLRQHRAVVDFLVTAHLAAVAAMLAYRTATVVAAAATSAQTAALSTYHGVVFLVTALTKGWTAATVGLTAAQEALDGALVANPIGIVIVAIAALVAGIIYAYTHFKTFRDVVDGAIHGVAAAGIWLWQSVLKPAFEGISTAVQWAWQHVISPTLSALVAYWQNVIAPVAMWLWHNIAEPVFAGIGRVTQAAWIVIQIVFNAWRSYIQGVLAPVLLWLWHNIVEPSFRGWMQIAQAAWAFLLPIFRAIGSFITDNVAPAFRSGVNAIGAAWDTLREKARVPVAFVVTHVINPLIGGFNRVAGFFGVKDRVDTIAGFAGGGQPNGLFRGAGGPRDDKNIVAISDREYIVNARDTERALPLLEWINGGMRGYAGGGLVEAITNPLGFFRNLANVGSLGRFGDGAWVRTLGGVATKLVDGAVAKVKASLSALGGGVFGGPAPSGQLAQWIASAIALTGVPATWTGPLNTLIMRESGGNPRAQNNTDINAQRGDPSRGLMQTIMATFQAYRLPGLPNDIFDPVANIVAGIRYVLSRYGSIFNVRQANASLPPMGYSTGGLVAALPTISMDSGVGILRPGMNLVHNGTGGNEMHSAGPVRLDDHTLAALVAALNHVAAVVEQVAPGVGAEINGAGRSLTQVARAR